MGGSPPLTSPPLTSPPRQLFLLVQVPGGPLQHHQTRFQVSSPVTAYIASNSIEDHCCYHCCQWTQNDFIDPGKVLRARIRYGRARIRKRLAGRQEMAAIFFDERKDETVIVVEVETSVTVEGQTDTQTATVKGLRGPRGPPTVRSTAPS